MRKIFAGAMAVSALGSIILGGALAWNASFTVDDASATVGVLSFDASYDESPDALLGPDGNTTTVGMIDLTNTGDFNLGWDSGVVIPTNLNAASSACDVANFTGQVTPLGAIQTAQGLAPGQDQLSAARVEITVRTGAPVACAGQTLSFDVVVTLKTLANVAP